jgi:hypothetical protein
MTDFGQKVKAAEREVRSKAKTPQNRSVAPKKKPPTKGSWKKGQSGNPETRFKPGISPNPGGRPQKTPITDAMREYLKQPYDGKIAKFKGLTNADVLAIKQFELAIEEGDMAAAKEIADRVEGKTVQIQQIQGPNGGAIVIDNMTPEQKRQRIAELEAKRRGTATS